MSYELRVTGSDEWRAAAELTAASLHFAPPNDEKWPQVEPSWADSHSISAWDGERCVGHGSYYPVQTSVPGGQRLGTAAVSRVGVRQTHTRRGILTAIMGRLLHDAHDQGLALTSLRASEAVIYGRFGYGMAGETISTTITRPVLRAGVGARGSFEILDPPAVAEVVAALYERIAFTRAGVISRPAWMWRRYLESYADRSVPRQVIVHRGAAGELDGFVDVETGWNEGYRGANATVHDLWGASPAVEAALWRYVFDIDLVDTVRADGRPVDDLVRWFLMDRRALQVTSVRDEQWMRLVDVDRALDARTWSSDDAVTITVRDRMLAHNNATWRIAAGAVERSPSGDVDLTVDVAALGAAYLGGTSWFELATTGDVEVHDPEAVARADRVFQSRPLPYCGSFF